MMGCFAPSRACRVGPAGSARFKERIDFGETIGTYINPETGLEVPSSKGMRSTAERIDSVRLQ